MLHILLPSFLNTFSNVVLSLRFFSKLRGMLVSHIRIIFIMQINVWVSMISFHAYVDVSFENKREVSSLLAALLWK